MRNGYLTLVAYITYKAVNSGIVLLMNNMPCKTVGIRIVRIKMHDGIIWTLIDV